MIFVEQNEVVYLFCYLSKEERREKSDRGKDRSLLVVTIDGGATLWFPGMQEEFNFFHEISRKSSIRPVDRGKRNDLKPRSKEKKLEKGIYLYGNRESKWIG